jgi:hypothetical protein
VAKPVLLVKMRSNRVWIAPIGLEIAVEVPDQSTHAALRGPLRIGERIELVNQTFGMGAATSRVVWPAASSNRRR